MLMSLAVVFFGMQLMMVGPLKGRLDGIQTRLDLSDRNMEKLVGTQDGIEKANNLLASLEEQSGRLSEMEQAITSIAALRSQVETEADSATVALQALERVAAVQKRIIASRQETDGAIDQIAKLETLRDEIVSGANRTQIAENSFDGMMALQKRVIAAANGYEDASNSIANLTDLTQRLVESDKDLKVASARFDDFIGLQNRMIAAAKSFDEANAGFAKAQESTGKLAALKDQILTGSKNVENAETAARTLVAMNDTLNGENLQLESAWQNLEKMVKLQTDLGEQTTRVAAAIQNLELMDDFQMEVATHINTLDSVRRTLMEVAMMETTIGRVAQVVAPLAEIGNLRRLSQSEVRDAARIILHQRSTRLSQAPDKIEASSPAEKRAESDDEDLVPLPPEARNL